MYVVMKATSFVPKNHEKKHSTHKVPKDPLGSSVGGGIVGGTGVGGAGVGGTGVGGAGVGAGATGSMISTRFRTARLTINPSVVALLIV